PGLQMSHRLKLSWAETQWSVTERKGGVVGFSASLLQGCCCNFTQALGQTSPAVL
ncbi:uncharacterized, partial [Tachysurus ichikawai]